MSATDCFWLSQHAGVPELLLALVLNTAAPGSAQEMRGYSTDGHGLVDMVGVG